MLHIIEFLLVPGEGAVVLWSIVIRCDEVVTDKGSHGKDCRSWAEDLTGFAPIVLWL